MKHSIQHPKGQSDFFATENARRKWGLSIPAVPALDELNSNQSWLLSIYLGKPGEQSNIFYTIKELWDCFETPTKFKKKIDERTNIHIEKGDFKECALQKVGMRWVRYNLDNHQIDENDCVSRPLNHSEVLSLAIFSKNLFQKEHENWSIEMGGFMRAVMMSIEKEKKNVVLTVACL